MKYKYWYVFFATLLVFACNNSSSNSDNGNNGGNSGNSNGSLESSSSSSEYSYSSSSFNEYLSSNTSEPNADISSSSAFFSSSSSISPPSEVSSSSETSSPSDLSSSSNINLSSGGTVKSSSSEAPPEVTTWPKLKEGDSGVLKGWGSRYWDGCKPHCALRNNVDTSATPFKICRNCNKNNKEIPTFTLSPDIVVRLDQNTNKIVEDWIGYKETVSSCEQGGISYVCWDMAPIALTDSLAYAFVAGTLKKPVCGHCFQVQFDGGTHNGPQEIKDAHKKLKGKTLIVMATNTGGDVEEGQFDIMVPGGGPGMFDSFADQIGVPKNQLGEGFGGFLTTCQREINDYNKLAEVYQDCVRKKCNAVFSKPEHKDLLRGCLWFTDWFMAADNPTFISKEVPCPKYFTDKYTSTINKSKDNKIEPFAGFNKPIPAGYETEKWKSEWK